MKKAKVFGAGSKALCLAGAVVLATNLIGCQGNGTTKGTEKGQIDSLKLDTVIAGGSDSLSVDVNLKVALRYPTDPALQAVVMQVVGGGVEAPSPREYADQLVRDYKNLVTTATADWKKYAEAEGESVGTPHPYEAEESVEFAYEDENILSMQKYVFTYTGGAHGLSGTQNFVIDKKSRARVTEDQLFAGGYQEELGRIIRAHLMKSYSAASQNEMNEKGFFDFEKVAPNGNLYFTDKELVYLYNGYEIAAYALGPIEVVIPLEEVKGLLSKESILHQYIK